MMDSVKKAFVLCSKALKLFYVLAVFNIIANTINLLIIPAPVDEELTLGRSLLVILVTIILALLGVFMYSGALAYIKDLIKTGSANLASFINNGKKYWLKFLGISVIVGLVFTISYLILYRIAGILPGAVKPIFIIVMIAALLALLVLLIMPGYALVGSDLSVVESIKKGVLVGKKNFLKVLGIIAIMFLVSVILLIVATIIIGILSFALRPISNFIAAIIMAIGYAAIGILASIAYMDFYLKSAGGAEQSPQQSTQV
jgi:hypothetical protein